MPFEKRSRRDCCWWVLRTTAGFLVRMCISPVAAGPRPDTGKDEQGSSQDGGREIFTVFLCPGLSTPVGSGVYVVRVIFPGRVKMKHLVARTLIGLAAALAVALPCAAQVSVVGCIFDNTSPQITDDPNRCPADRRLDIVSIKTSWTQSATVGSAGGGAGAGKVQVGPFLISKNLDRTSPALFLDVVTGRHVRGVLVAVFDSSNGR